MTDTRNEKEHRELLEIACENNGLVKDIDYWVSYRKLDDGYGYFNYFTKYGNFYDVVLFQKGEGKKKAIQKFYEIGKGKWFYKSKELIWEDVKAYLQAKFNTDIEENETPDYYEEFLGYTDQTYSDIEIPSDMSQESIDRINEKYKSEQDNILETEIIVEVNRKEKVSDWFGCPLDYHLPQKNILPQKQIRDKRYEWDRYRYSIAFLN